MVQQAIPVRKGELWLNAMAENLTNNQQAVSRNAGYVYAQNRWVIVNRQNPLQLSLGLRYKF